MSHTVFYIVRQIVLNLVNKYIRVCGIWFSFKTRRCRFPLLLAPLSSLSKWHQFAASHWCVIINLSRASLHAFYLIKPIARIWYCWFLFLFNRQKISKWKPYTKMRSVAEVPGDNQSTKEHYQRKMKWTQY